MSKLDTTKYDAMVANAAANVKISSTKFKDFIGDVKDVVDKNSPEGQYAADAGTTDAYVVTLDPAPSAYFESMVVRFAANTANTGACTLNVNSLGAKTIKKNTSDDMETGDIAADQIIEVVYDGNNFQFTGAATGEIATHKADTAAHSATSDATASRIMSRDPSGRSKVANPAGAGDVMNLSEKISAAFASGNTATSTTAIVNGEVYLLATLCASGANSGTSGLYLIAKQGTSNIITAVSADASMSVTVDANSNVVLTNTSGGSRSLNGTLIKVR